MKFTVQYPDGLEAPKGLFIPRMEDVRQAVALAEILIKYIDVGFEADDVFPISVCDEVLVNGGKLIDASLTEGVMLYPSATRWTVESIFEVVLSSLLNDEKAVAISKVNLTEIAEEVKDLINFIWNSAISMNILSTRALLLMRKHYK